MAKKQETEVVEKTANEPKGDVIKVKAKMKKTAQVAEETITKVDLSKPAEAEVKEIKDEQSVESTEQPVQVVEEVVDEPIAAVEETTEAPIVEEVTNEKVEEVAVTIDEAITESMETGEPLPENIQKLMSFMEETGGDLTDYVTLNQDYSELDNHTLLKEYYKSTKPHLSDDEVDFVMEDTFSYDEEIDEDRDIKRKKLAMKEQVAQARQHLDGAKSKYYEDIKYGSKLTGEQQKAVDFFNRYTTESKEQEKVADKQHKTFLNKTDKLFNKEFKGFEYKVGEKKFRFNVKDSDTVKNTQSDINNFVKKFLNKNNEMEDAKGYHKSMYTAMNPDKIASHFYEQGKADALKNSVAKSKNISMNPRQQHDGVIDAGGIKVRVLGNNSNDFKFKIKNK